MPSKKPNSGRWSVYPSHHDDISRLLEEDDLYSNIHIIDDSESSTKYDTNIMGRFMCHNNACNFSGWSSKKIAITIRLYSGAKYNARVYHQRCEGCNRLSRPLLNESYAGRVVYRIQKWSGIQMDLPHYSGKSKGPHNKNLCEGCKYGHCSALLLGWFKRIKTAEGYCSIRERHDLLASICRQRKTSRRSRKRTSPGLKRGCNKQDPTSVFKNVFCSILWIHVFKSR